MKQQSEIPQTLPASSAQQIVSARSIQATPALSPAKHFRMTGQIVFHDYDDATQRGELWLGGATRMRFAIGGDGVKNVILLDGDSGCWKKTPGTEFVDYPDGAEVLTTETELRWYILRMPWDDDDQRFSYQLDEQGLPSMVVMGETSVQLSDYKVLGKKGTLYPTVWRWKSPTDNRTETFSELQDGAIFLDKAFVPPTINPLNSLRLAHSDAQSLADRIGIVSENFYYLSEQDFTSESQLPKGWWWTNDKKRYFVFEQQPEFQIENMQSITGKTWMRWATYADITQSTGVGQLLKVVEQTGYENTGAVWSKEIKDRSQKRLKVFLVPVTKG